MKKLILGGIAVLLVMTVLLVGCGQKYEKAEIKKAGIEKAEIKKAGIEKAEIKIMNSEEKMDVYYSVSKHESGETWFIYTSPDGDERDYIIIGVDKNGEVGLVNLYQIGADFYGYDDIDMVVYRTIDGNYQGTIKVSFKTALNFSELPISYYLQRSLADTFDRLPYFREKDGGRGLVGISFKKRDIRRELARKLFNLPEEPRGEAVMIIDVPPYLAIEIFQEAKHILFQLP